MFIRVDFSISILTDSFNHYTLLFTVTIFEQINHIFCTFRETMFSLPELIVAIVIGKQSRYTIDRISHRITAIRYI